MSLGGGRASSPVPDSLAQKGDGAHRPPLYLGCWNGAAVKRDLSTIAFKEDQRARSDAADSMPVKRGCICPNGGRPDESGTSYYCPSCQVAGHGLRALYVIHNISFGGFDEVIEEPPRSKSNHRPRLPVNTESLRADARLNEATRQCRERLYAAGAPNQ